MLPGRWQICCFPADPGSAILAKTGPSQGDRIIYSSSQEVETLCGMHNWKCLWTPQLIEIEIQSFICLLLLFKFRNVTYHEEGNPKYLKP